MEVVLSDARTARRSQHSLSVNVPTRRQMLVTRIENVTFCAIRRTDRTDKCSDKDKNACQKAKIAQKVHAATQLHFKILLRSKCE